MSSLQKKGLIFDEDDNRIMKRAAKNIEQREVMTRKGRDMPELDSMQGFWNHHLDKNFDLCKSDVMKFIEHKNECYLCDSTLRLSKFFPVSLEDVQAYEEQMKASEEQSNEDNTISNSSSFIPYDPANVHFENSSSSNEYSCDNYDGTQFLNDNRIEKEDELNEEICLESENEKEIENVKEEDFDEEIHLDDMEREVEKDNDIYKYTRTPARLCKDKSERTDEETREIIRLRRQRTKLSRVAKAFDRVERGEKKIIIRNKDKNKNNNNYNRWGVKKIYRESPEEKEERERKEQEKYLKKRERREKFLVARRKNSYF
jgi:hypothetical protein